MALPIVSPAQGVAISPESLEIANTYLSTQNITATADKLGLPTDVITDTLSKREVKAYIDTVFADFGFNNQFRIRQVMDLLIQRKLEELDEAEVGSGKDIADLLALSHKMTMDVLDRQIKLESLKAGNKPTTQVNMQVNEFGGTDTKYGSLISKLLGGNT